MYTELPLVVCDTLGPLPTQRHKHSLFPMSFSSRLSLLDTVVPVPQRILFASCSPVLWFLNRMWILFRGIRLLMTLRESTRTAPEWLELYTVL